MLTTSSRVAIGAMGLLAAAYNQGSSGITAEKLAEAGPWPRPFLSKVLATLARHGLVRGARGPGGGYVLTRAPFDITLFEIVGCFEALNLPDECALGQKEPCGRLPHCALHNPMQKVRDSLTSFLRNTTLAPFQAQRGPTPRSV